MIKAKVIIRMDSGNLLKSSWFNYNDAIKELKIYNLQSKLNVQRGQISCLQILVLFVFLKSNHFSFKQRSLMVNKQLIQNVYPVDGYVYELKFKNYSKFYQHVDDAFNEKLHSPEDPKIVRHPLNFTSPFVQKAESASLIVDGKMNDFNYLIDINSDDIEPKHAKLKENLLAMFRGAICGITLISIFNFIYQIIF